MTRRDVAADLGLSVGQLQREDRLAREVLGDYLLTEQIICALEPALTPPLNGEDVQSVMMEQFRRVLRSSSK